jgi:sec-independent protein translocase protein TatC
MPFTSHLGELRSRLIKSVIAISIAFVGCFAVVDQIFVILAAPLRRLKISGLTLIGTAVAEAFFTKMKVAFVAAIVVALPVLLWQSCSLLRPVCTNMKNAIPVPLSHRLVISSPARHFAISWWSSWDSISLAPP